MLFPNIFLLYQVIVVNAFSGSKDSNYEASRVVWNKITVVAVMLLVIKKRIM